MTVWYPEALAGIALALSILMAMAWVVQQRTGNSGWSTPSGRFRWGSPGPAARYAGGSEWGVSHYRIKKV